MLTNVLIYLFFYSDGFYCPYGAYGHSKLAVILGTYELDRRLHDADFPVTINCLHPGVVNTNLYRHLPAIMQPIKKLFSALQFMWVSNDF